MDSNVHVWVGKNIKHSSRASPWSRSRLGMARLKGLNSEGVIFFLFMLKTNFIIQI